MANKIIPALLAAGLLGTSSAAFAGGGFASEAQLHKDAWAAEAFAEPCMNGEVSANGLFSSQLEENKAVARMGAAFGPES